VSIGFRPVLAGCNLSAAASELNWLPNDEISHSQTYFTTGGDRQSVRLDNPLRLTTSFFFKLNICCYSPYVTTSLMRGWVCRLELQPVLVSALILRSESCKIHDHILLSQIRDSPQPEVPGPRIYMPQEQGGPVIPPGSGFPFRRLLRLAGLRWWYSTPPPHGVNE
jgi:hypothetical protein